MAIQAAMFSGQSAPRMLRSRWFRLGALCAVLMLVLTSASSVAAGSGGGRSLEVLSQATSFKSVQADPATVAPGDELFIGGNVMQHATPHSQIGTFGVHCVATGAGGSQILCDAAYALPKGQITLEVLVASQPPQQFDAAITGGTGAYRNVRGSATVVTLSQTEDDVTFHLIGG